MSTASWWDEMGAEVEANDGPMRWSAAWYIAMRDLYLVRFPNADERSKFNMQQFARVACEREGVLDLGGVT